MSNDLIKLQFRHSQGMPLGIDIITLKALYDRQPALNHIISEPHGLGFYILFYVSAGEGHHTVDFQKYEVEPGTLAIISKQQIQAFDPTCNLSGYMVLFTEDFLHRALFDLEGSITRLLFEPATTQTYFLRNANAALPHIHRLIQEYNAGIGEPEQVPILTRELGILLLKAEQLRRLQLSEKERKAEAAPRLMAFRELLDKHFKSHWTAQMYADALRCSKRTLGALTRKYLNRSPKEVIDQRMGLEIKRLLAHTGYSVKEIAFQLGFDDPSNLNKFFRRVHGDTPSEFRRRV